MWSISSSERNWFQALQMLRKLSILHQEDENERATSSELAYCVVGRCVIRSSKSGMRQRTILMPWRCSRWRRLFQLCSSIYCGLRKLPADWEAKAEKDAAEKEETLMSCDELPHNFSCKRIWVATSRLLLWCQKTRFSIQLEPLGHQAQVCAWACLDLLEQEDHRMMPQRKLCFQARRARTTCKI